MRLLAGLVYSAAAVGAVPPQAVAAQGFTTVDSAVEAGIRQGIYPGAVVIIGRRAEVLYARGYGRLTWASRSSVPTPDSTLWDLASLTKVVATTPAILRLVGQGRIALDSPVSRYLPRFRGDGRDRVTVRMLLDHTSGLPSYRPFFRLAPGRDSALGLLHSTPLIHPPGSHSEYSDLNFMLLGLMVEAVSGDSLSRVVAREVTGPAGLDETMFRPDAAAGRRAAPTAVWRGQPVRGVVNDQNAVRLGGVAGHAGLFATGNDLARVARMWLGWGTVDGIRILDSAVVAAALAPQPAAGDRRLGWESPDSANRTDTFFGTLVSGGTFGHTGWTGTCMWMDPTRDLFLVFLTNRSFQPKIGHSIRALRAVRARVSDAAVRAVAGPPAP